MIETKYLKLAQQAVTALKWEVSFSPKPGLVDAKSNGSHKDMDIDLFYKSADSLLAGFEEMIQVSYQHPLDLALREEIGRIGRVAEKDMFTATNGINTHKGAIWSMGLLVSVISSLQTDDLETIFAGVKKLSRMPDKYVQATKKTHGMITKQKYALNGAKGEAQSGFANVSKVLSFQPESDDYDTWLKRLLLLYSNVNDTNVVYRSNLQVLQEFQTLSAQIVVSKQTVLDNPKFQTLQKFTQKYNISPGGCADLFAASYFLKHLN
ncbi:triphosphoribosyl-dephospho-CoA synthase [Companilactobacillus kimchii]|uniref:triphosphoribosyl-dephospho-CoA synthase n=2 Tax=Companilactobacillus kimchii TaxID=2801452 RepID=A0ABR5NV76_9LACO|nr:triphosphoribosyl-dephospho-CoA synthase [Companilactobacillus kimchii]KAE9563127.1 triphosphoribosyl-dephospho-CoA synthase [Companilactobacillus kimchii]KRK52644.1 triphosphoribosyl-dephospho-CoA synthase MdcB [Companilactobacillus kimchii DSM 13961 = JCM 10707]OWF32295.1 Triphosphoribosyl-dephospho-CoA synthase [Companilactobacillus kimchii]GEO47315.1 triphosphoribosyl-dephospho-CoA synthase MdcB [Companilactobacillus paralimentarius]